ncbi:hypothetical protein C8J56DRAFT_903332 [Mycena floridula]|nr:hypothetical protein C8J56DRAFT_903332 [Mycena floridula]
MWWLSNSDRGHFRVEENRKYVASIEGMTKGEGGRTLDGRLFEEALLDGQDGPGRDLRYWDDISLLARSVRLTRKPYGSGWKGRKVKFLHVELEMGLTLFVELIFILCGELKTYLSVKTSIPHYVALKACENTTKSRGLSQSQAEPSQSQRSRPGLSFEQAGADSGQAKAVKAEPKPGRHITTGVGFRFVITVRGRLKLVIRQRPHHALAASQFRRPNSPIRISRRPRNISHSTLDAYPDIAEYRYFWVLLHRKLFPEVVVDNSSLEYLRQRALRGCKVHNTWKSPIIYPTSIQCDTAQRAEFLPDGDTLLSVSADGKPHLIRIGQSDGPHLCVWELGLRGPLRCKLGLLVSSSDFSQIGPENDWKAQGANSRSKSVPESPPTELGMSSRSAYPIECRFPAHSFALLQVYHLGYRGIKRLMGGIRDAQKGKIPPDPSLSSHCNIWPLTQSAPYAARAAPASNNISARLMSGFIGCTLRQMARMVIVS